MEIRKNRESVASVRQDAEAADTAASAVHAGVSSEERRHLVSEAAYYRAQRRDFAPGYELDDWLEAEEEIETLLSRERATASHREA